LFVNPSFYNHSLAFNQLSVIGRKTAIFIFRYATLPDNFMTLDTAGMKMKLLRVLVAMARGRCKKMALNKKRKLIFFYGAKHA